jgi:outer membrane protein assembly factor BamA
MRVHNVHFVNAAQLSSEQKSELTEAVRALDVVRKPSLEASIEREAQYAYANQGYWQAKFKVEVSASDAAGDGAVDVILRVLEEGHRYRLRGIRWSGVSAFPEAHLTELMPLREGDLLDRSKIAEGIDAVRALYMWGGYLSYVAVPEVEMQKDGTADLRINVDEGGAFTVQNFDVVGLSATQRMRLLRAWPFRRGDIYRGENVENFIAANTSLMPATDHDVVCRTIDLSKHTVGFVLDFRPQPIACNTLPEIQLSRQNPAPARER